MGQTFCSDGQAASWWVMEALGEKVVQVAPLGPVGTRLLHVLIFPLTLLQGTAPGVIS